MDPIRSLYWSAIVNGIVAVPLMFMLMHISSKTEIVGQFKLPLYLRVVAWTATILMFLASFSFLISVIARLL